MDKLNSKNIVWRWILLLPSTILISYIIGLMTKGSETGFYFFGNFVKALLFVVTAFIIAPKHKILIAYSFGFAWIAFATIVLIGITYFNWFKYEGDVENIFSVSIGILGAVFGMYYCKKENDKEKEEKELDEILNG